MNQKFAFSNFLSIAKTNNDDDVVAAAKYSKAYSENPFNNDKPNLSNWRLELKFHLKREFSSLQCCTCESSAKLIECFSSSFKWKSEKKRFTSAATSSTEPKWAGSGIWKVSLSFEIEKLKKKSVIEKKGCWKGIESLFRFNLQSKRTTRR